MAQDLIAVNNNNNEVNIRIGAQNSINRESVCGVRSSEYKDVPRNIQNNLTIDAKFMDNFDPKQSSRTMKKRSMDNKFFSENVYDSSGRYRHSGVDACDCLEDDCVGCHFPCKHCSSTKCGPSCRVNRRYCYEFINCDEKKKTILNWNSVY